MQAGWTHGKPPTTGIATGTCVFCKRTAPLLKGLYCDELCYTRATRDRGWGPNGSHPSPKENMCLLCHAAPKYSGSHYCGNGCVRIAERAKLPS